VAELEGNVDGEPRVGVLQVVAEHVHRLLETVAKGVAVHEAHARRAIVAGEVERRLEHAEQVRAVLAVPDDEVAQPVLDEPAGVGGPEVVPQQPVQRVVTCRDDRRDRLGVRPETCQPQQMGDVGTQLAGGDAALAGDRVGGGREASDPLDDPLEPCNRLGAAVSVRVQEDNLSLDGRAEGGRGELGGLADDALREIGARHVVACHDGRAIYARQRDARRGGLPADAVALQPRIADQAGHERRRMRAPQARTRKLVREQRGDEVDGLAPDVAVVVAVGDRERGDAGAGLDDG
jgi:hypothetical protein